MTSLRTLALATLLVACSRDDARQGTDSLPPSRSDTGARVTAPPATDTTPALSRDTVPLGRSRITVERAVVNGILWGASEEDVRRSLGEPQSVNMVWEEALGDSATVMHFAGLTVRVVERRVVGVHCTAQTCITGDAVRVGATRAEVEQVYGKGQEEKAGPDGQIAYPFTTDDSCALRFELRQSKVRAIDVSCQMN